MWTDPTSSKAFTSSNGVVNSNLEFWPFFRIETDTKFPHIKGKPKDRVQWNFSESFKGSIEPITRFKQTLSFLDYIEEGNVPDYTTIKMLENNKSFKSRPHQNINIAKLLHFKTYAIFDDPGTGKTLLLGGAIQHGRSIGNFKKVILSPGAKILINQWEDELSKNFGFKVFTITNQNPQKRKEIYEEFEREDEAILLLSPGVIRNDVKPSGNHINSPLIRMKKDLIIVDEADFLANQKSAQTKSFIKLRETTVNAWVATATPADRNVQDFFGLFHYLFPEISYYQYITEFFIGKEIRFGLRVVQEWTFNEGKKQTLLNIQRIWTTRVKLEDLFGTANDHKEEYVTLKISNEQKQLVTSQIETSKTSDEVDIWKYGFDENDLTNLMVLMKRNQQVEIDPRILYPETNPGVKTEWILDYIKNNPNEKILIFSFFKSYLKILEQDIKKLGLKVGMINGEVSTNKRDEYKKDFMEGDLQILLLQTKAGGAGLDLNKATTTIVVELDWKPSLNKQVKQRMRQDTAGKKYFVLGAGEIDKLVRIKLSEKWNDTKFVNEYRRFLQEMYEN